MHLAGKMCEHGDALQTYTLEIVKCLEDLKEKRLDLQQIINKQENEKTVLENNAKIIMDKLAVLNKNLSQNVKMRDSYDETIKETESGFKKIVESSQTLLNVLQHESSRLEDGVVIDKKDSTKLGFKYDFTNLL